MSGIERQILHVLTYLQNLKDVGKKLSIVGKGEGKKEQLLWDSGKEQD